MSIKDNIIKFLDTVGLQAKAGPAFSSSSLGSGVDPFAIWQSSKKVAPTKAMDVYAGWVYACVRAIAEELANIKLKLYRVKSDGSTEELDEHELLTLLRQPNSYQTGYEFLYQIGSHLELIGNSYLYLDGVNDETGKPKNIFTLNPRHIKVLRGKLPTPVVGYEYRDPAGTTIYQPFQILHPKYPDPNDPYEGIGTVQAIAQWIDADNYATEFNRRFFKNGARIGGTLESESAITPEQLDYLKKSFEAIYSGVENAYKVAALPKGTKYVDNNLNAKEMDFVEGQKLMRDKILAGFRVPKTALGIVEDVNRANAEATNYVFALRTIRPKMQSIVNYLNEFLVPRYGEDLYLDFVDPVPQDRALEMQELQISLAGQPALSVNEARENYFNAPPISNGDSVLTDFSKMPLGAPEKKAMASRLDIKKMNFIRRGKKQTRKNVANEIAKAATEAIKSFEKTTKEVKKKAHKDITTLNNEEYGMLHKAFALRVEPYSKGLKQKIADFNEGQKKKVLDNLSEATKAVSRKKGINTGKLFDKKKEVGILIDLAGPILTDLYQKEGVEAADLIGAGELDILNPQTKKALDKAIALMSGSYNDTTLNLLKDKLEAGLESGAGLDELKDIVSAIYDFSDSNRAEQVARTETFRVANDATKEAWKQSGVVETLKWYTAADEAVCPFCGEQHGKVISINEDFYSKGDTVTGSDGSQMDIDYSDVGAPPLHVSCRCYIRPDKITLKTPEPEIKDVENLDIDDEKVEAKIQAHVGKVKKELSEKIDKVLEE